ncbi:hypothetical protein [Nostoc sp. KVJ20]|nr:hypothetical protein [Nostoc sp. KVJ20]
MRDGVFGHGEEVTNAQCPKRRGGCPSAPTRGWSFPPLSKKLGAIA